MKPVMIAIAMKAIDAVATSGTLVNIPAITAVKAARTSMSAKNMYTSNVYPVLFVINFPESH